MNRHSLWNFISFATSARLRKRAASAGPPGSHTFLSRRFPSKVRKLEDDLGARLFDHLGRSVRPTNRGNTFLPRARARKDTPSGTVVIGVIPAVAPYLLPGLLVPYLRKYPQARVSVVEEITSVLLDRLRAGSIDVAILALPLRRHEFETFPLLAERLFTALPKKHKFTRRAAFSLKDLRTIIPTISTIHQTLSSNHTIYSGEDNGGKFWVATPGCLDQFHRRTGIVAQHISILEAPYGFASMRTVSAYFGFFL